MESNQGEFCWNELATSNRDAAKDFYGKLFGWQFIDRDMGNNMTYTVVQNQGKPMGGIWAIPKGEQIPPHWMSYINVDDVEAFVKKATQAGGVVVQPPTEAGDMGFFAVIQDPTGAHFALWQAKK